MLHNNLDPEVAERPDDLDRLRRQRQGRPRLGSFDAIVAELRSLENDETLLVQSGSRSGMFRTHPDAPRVLIANSNLVGHWANFEEFTPPRTARPHHVRPDDRRLVDLHRDARESCRAPTRRSPRCARKHFGGSLAGQARRLRRHGRNGGRPAARRDHDGGVVPGHRGGSARASSKRLETGYCDRMTDDLDEALADRLREAGERASRSAWSATAPTSARARRAAASSPTCSPSRPAPTIR